jgi:energy-coupling factor transporter transmembrane protein EcfT
VEQTAPVPVVKARTAWWKPKTAAKAKVVEPVVEAAPARRRPFSGPGSRSNPLLLLAAALLVAGAVLGNLLVLLVGWLIAWASRRLSDAETKWAVVFLPSLSLTAGIVWLWGRNEGRWGEPIAQGHMNDAVAETWPWVVRGAAVASALFLVWRSQRRR